MELHRIGSPADGGYISPSPSFSQACFSAGVETNVDFELEIAQLGIKTYMIDHSISLPPVDYELFHFTKKALSGKSSESDNLVLLDHWINEKEPNTHDLIIKIDIEGSEWDVLEKVPTSTLSKTKILIVEFHWMAAVKHKQALSKIRLLLEKLLDTFDLIHVHPNNCARDIEIFNTTVPEVFEATFVQKSFNQPGDTVYSGLKLDSDNSHWSPSITLADYWPPISKTNNSQ
jgi:hypothetical protein